MESKLRPYATAGIALVGASVIAITPVAPPPLPDIRVAGPAVQLSASIDPITPWLNVFNTAEVNFADLANTWLEAPAPVLQQIIANQLGYLRELPDFETIVGQVAAHIEAVGQTLVGPGVGTGSLDASHEAILELLPMILDVPAALQPVLDFSTTFLSGVLLGLVGPVIGPVLALGANVAEIVANLTGETPDLGAAVNTLINTPAAMTDAFLNGGQSLDLTPVLTALGLNLELSPGIPITVGVTFGGLLSPGGSIFNALDSAS
ncbi:outer membrane porin GjpA [Mycolicibacterium mengxianglii]|uniref:outer membrane porin GjpA n=1 Tax=Mycolicibacterium mengxianglii TaxID=2736649 RepID=UPI001E4B35F8|nr:outer membrane porin GjpA [Mycolicibacterium mengxianglii]